MSPAILAGGEFLICQLQTHVAGFGGRGGFCSEHGDLQMAYLVAGTSPEAESDLGLQARSMVSFPSAALGHLRALAAPCGSR